MNRKSYLTSLAKCKQYDKILPFVEQHNQYRFTREPQEHPIEQTYGLFLIYLLFFRSFSSFNPSFISTYGSISYSKRNEFVFE